jgi:hypothetical protein
MATIVPAVKPTPKTNIVSRSDSRITHHRPAPKAIRLPSSLVLCATVYEATPKIPIHASSSPRRLKKALVAATIRVPEHGLDIDEQPGVYAADLRPDGTRDRVRVSRRADLQGH